MKRVFIIWCSIALGVAIAASPIGETKIYKFIASLYAP